MAQGFNAFGCYNQGDVVQIVNSNYNDAWVQVKYPGDYIGYLPKRYIDMTSFLPAGEDDFSHLYPNEDLIALLEATVPGLTVDSVDADGLAHVTISDMGAFTYLAKNDGQRNLIRHVTIAEGITEIPRIGLKESDALESLSIPSTIKKIATRSLADCPMLAEFIVPNNSGCTLEYAALTGAYSLKKIVLGEGTTIAMGDGGNFALRDWVLYSTSVSAGLTEIWLPSTIDANLFFETHNQDKDSLIGSRELTAPAMTKPGSKIMLPSKSLNTESGWIGISGVVRLYSGNVMDAYKKGTSATTSYCTKHDFSMAYRRNYNVMRYATCAQDAVYYKLCRNCGESSNNPSLTFTETSLSKNTTVRPHEVTAQTLSAATKICTDVNGVDHYWMSCIWCGKAAPDAEYHDENRFFDNTEGNKAEYLKELAADYVAAATYIKNPSVYVPRSDYFTQASNDVRVLQNILNVYSFSVENPVQAKMSDWALDGVTKAASEGLVDASLLGNDFTKAVSRLQFCDIVVRFTETVLHGTMTAAPTGTFTDTDNLAVRKAFAAGITSGTSATTFSPNSTLTRQDMATFIYRAMQFIEDNSSMRYTDYTSKLGAFSDSGKISAWAKEPMAFMNAIGLVKGTSNTAISPNGTCTIEQSILVAYRSMTAHLLGNYKANLVLSGVRTKFAPYNYDGLVTNNLYYNEPIWIQEILTNDETSANDDDAWGMFKDPQSGQTLYVKMEHITPVR